MSEKKDKFVTDWFYVPCASNTKLQPGGFLGLGEPKRVKDYINTVPDLDDFAKELAERYNRFDEAGYEIIEVVPINIGSSEPRFQDNKNYVGDASFSTTRGAVVVGRLKSKGNEQ